jgi:intracellular sulfur oxidation DsrE/DsrF family protein
MFKNLLALVFSLAFLGFSAQVLAAPPRVVYHINDADSQALAGLRNVRNQLDTEPTTKIVVVTHAKGVDFLMTDYKDADKVGPLVSALAARGVDFEVCEITLKNRNLKKDQFVLESNFTPSGVVLITKLENEGYAYLKP